MRELHAAELGVVNELATVEVHLSFEARAIEPDASELHITEIRLVFEDGEAEVRTQRMVVDELGEPAQGGEVDTHTLCERHEAATLQFGYSALEGVCVASVCETPAVVTERNR